MATRTKKVAVIHDWLIASRGGENVLDAILELYPEADIFTLFYDPEKVPERVRRHPVQVSFLNRLPLRRKFYRHYLPLFPLAIESFDLSGYDLVISSSHCVAKGVIVPPGARHVCFCHTPMRYAWDRQSDYFGTGWKSAPFLPFLHYLRLWDVTSSARVDEFVANSAWVAERIRKYYRRSSKVVHPFVDLQAFPPVDRFDGGYYLVVSAFAPYKRIDLAIEACEKMGRPLKVVGEGQDEARLRALAGPRIEFLGRRAPKDLRELYRGARALLFPGEEDFGITPLEAMACGTPVIAFGRGGATETIIDGKTGILFPDQTAAALAEAMARLEKDPGALSAHACRERAESFGRKVFQQKLAAVIEGERERPRDRESSELIY